VTTNLGTVLIARKRARIGFLRHHLQASSNTLWFKVIHIQQQKEQ